MPTGRGCGLSCLDVRHVRKLRHVRGFAARCKRKNEVLCGVACETVSRFFPCFALERSAGAKKTPPSGDLTDDKSGLIIEKVAS